ncbi:MAG: small ribosomal subunit biogenesis GTPase RsgA [Cyanobacteria bacterium Co-bin8]|nr:small ribosomal subunit biogenesis GTPase RsgA [Cyanobacteria bacterium Co-bin8]
MPEGTAIAPETTQGYWGTVLAVQANYYWVKLNEVTGEPAPALPDPVVDSVQSEPRPENLLCTRRARLKKMGQRVMVGDRVRVEEPDWAGGRGAIAQVLPRSTVLDRPPVANADQILLVFALSEPELDPFQLSRFLVKAEATGIAINLCLNKRDLVDEQTRQAWIDRLHAWGYTPTLISVQTESMWPELNQQLKHHITVVSGPSGVGKSSLINHLIPAADLRTGAVSGKLGRGRHTTRHVELFELPSGGFLADTPGFNQPDVTCAPEELADCFPEIRQRLAAQSCQFSDCLHRDEPGCAVGNDWERYEHYLVLLEEAVERQESLNQQRDPEAAFKVKTTEAGAQHEPMLQAKKYRRISRRSRNQALQDLCDDLIESAGHLEELDELAFDEMD